MPQPVDHQFAAPPEVGLRLRGREEALVVRPAPVRVLLKLKAVVLPVLEDIVRQAPGLLSGERINLIMASGEITAGDVAELVVVLEQVDAAIPFVALLSGLPEADVAELLPDEFALLAAVAVQVNADFFVQARPAFEVAMGRFSQSGVLPSPAPAPAAASAGQS
jgi:hypothetical protein